MRNMGNSVTDGPSKHPLFWAFALRIRGRCVTGTKWVFLHPVRVLPPNATEKSSLKTLCGQLFTYVTLRLRYGYVTESRSCYVTLRPPYIKGRDGTNARNVPHSRSAASRKEERGLPRKRSFVGSPYGLSACVALVALVALPAGDGRNQISNFSLSQMNRTVT